VDPRIGRYVDTYATHHVRLQLARGTGEEVDRHRPGTGPYVARGRVDRRELPGWRPAPACLPRFSRAPRKNKSSKVCDPIIIIFFFTGRYATEAVACVQQVARGRNRVLRFGLIIHLLAPLHLHLDR
jgi:hypothetical protein